MIGILTRVGLPVAAFAAVLAILDRANPAVEVPAAILAIVAAALAVVDAVRPTAPEMPPAYGSETEWLGRVREAFRSEQLGREDLVRILDQVERASANPGLPLRSVEYFGQASRASEDEFHRYLAARLDALETAT